MQKFPMSIVRKKGLSYGQTDMLCLSVTKWTLDASDLKYDKKKKSVTDSANR